MNPRDDSSPPASDHRPLMWAVVASQFAPPFMFSGVAVALPTMGVDLAAGATSLGLVESLFLAGNLAFLLPFGRLADATDKNTLFKAGLVSFGVTSLLIAVSSWMPAILALRFLQGVTAALFATTGPAILTDIVPPGERGRAFGLSMGAIYSGLTLGPIVAGFLVGLWGWRAVFLFGAALLLAGAVRIQRKLPSSWRRPVKSVHLPSTVLIVLAVLLAVAGSSTVRQGPTGYALLAGSIVLAAVFLDLQRRVTRPLVDVGAVLRNRPLSMALTIQLLLYFSAFSSIFLLNIYMQVALGLSPERSGQVLAIGSVTMAAMAPVAGRLADRYRPRPLSALGVACVLASTLLATTLDAGSTAWWVVPILAVQGLGFAFFSSPNMKVVMGSVAPGAVSMASALGAASRSLGMNAGMLIIAVLMSLNIGNDPIERHPAEFTDLMGTAFAILSAVSILALLGALSKSSSSERPEA